MFTRFVVAVCALTLAILALLPAVLYARKKTDIVFLGNGDRITCEITKLDRAILQAKTDDVGTLNIEWEDVDSLSSVYQFRVEEDSGVKHFGAIFLTRAGVLQVIQEGRVEEVPHADVVNIMPLEASFWQQLDGSISIGFSYTQSNSLGQLSTDIYVVRRTEIRLVSLDASSLTTSQEDEDTQRREDATVSYARLFDGPLFAISSFSGQSNDELGLDLRLLFSAGMGINVIQSNHNDLMTALGLSVNREWSADESDDGYNLEAFVTAQHSVFRYDYPKTDVTSEITVYPGLTEWGRIRAEIDISASREIVRDFTFVLSFYDSYDSDPADPTAVKNDYGLVTSLGWTF